jgi:tetratricopeptide (TPR) repeat protein
MVKLNIDDSYTHSAIANFLCQGEKDYAGALRELDLIDAKFGNGKSSYEQRAEILRNMGRINESLNYLKKQSELFPRASAVLSKIAETYKLQRNFDSSLYYINKAIEITPDVAGLYMLKSMYYAELKGDISTASSILENASLLVDTSGFKSDFGYFESLKGNFENAIRYTKQDIDSLGLLWQYKFFPSDLAIAIMYRVQGQDGEAKLYFQKSLGLTSRFVRQYPDDFRMHSAIGVALAGLGEREKALIEGKRACELMPVSKDAILGISPLESLALIHTLLGDQDEAIDILEQMLKMPFAWTMSNTIPLYKIHYYWKPLRSNPRFQKMIEGSR